LVNPQRLIATIALSTATKILGKLKPATAAVIYGVFVRSKGNILPPTKALIVPIITVERIPPP